YKEVVRRHNQNNAYIHSENKGLIRFSVACALGGSYKNRQLYLVFRLYTHINFFRGIGWQRYWEDVVGVSIEAFSETLVFAEVIIQPSFTINRGIKTYFVERRLVD